MMAQSDHLTPLAKDQLFLAVVHRKKVYTKKKGKLLNQSIVSEQVHT